MKDILCKVFKLNFERQSTKIWFKDSARQIRIAVSAFGLISQIAIKTLLSSSFIDGEGKYIIPDIINFVARLC